MRLIIGLLISVVAVLAAASVLVFSSGSPAAATGTVQVQQDDNSIQYYKNATIVVSNQTLRITTADKKGTLLIDKAACYLVGKVLQCLPYSMTLDQGGGATPLDFKVGTVYLNTTNESQPLPATSQRLPGNGIMLSLTTRIGTIVNVTGTIDKNTK